MSDLHQHLASLSAAQRRQLADRLSARNSPPRLQAFVVLRPGTNATTPEDLKLHLQRHLPAHALPARITILDELPRLPNGKVDRRALPSLEPAPSAIPESPPPATAAETTLLTIWQEVLGTNQISIHDDFFELGGDSILSIQIVSRARSAGLKISPGDFADHPTIAKLAAVAGPGSSAPSEAEEELDSGPIPLTPIQNWFFDLGLAQPTQWNQGLSLGLAPEVSVEMIETAVRAVTSQHPQLRAGFRPHGETWIQEVQPSPPDLEILTENGSQSESAVKRLQESFRFDGSPLTRFALLPHDASRRLVVIAHHLVMDNISWRILIEDLTKALQHARATHPIEFGARSASYSHWARRPAAADTQPSSSEITAWAAPHDADYGRLPRDHQWDGELLEADSTTHRVELDASQSAQLFTQSGAAYNTRAEDLLFTALARTLMRLTGRDRFRIGLERHGRDALGDLIDVSRTIGWFTTYFPLRVSLEGLTDPGAAIKSVKEQLRAVPRSGLGYGQLRYGSDPDRARAVSADEDAEDVLFNYLGAGSAHLETREVRSASPLLEHSRAGENRRSHLLEINCSQQDGVLHMEWIFNSRAHRGSTIEEWSQLYFSELDELLTHCATVQTSYTPSDFPEAEMNQEELDEFLEEL